MGAQRTLNIVGVDGAFERVLTSLMVKLGRSRRSSASSSAGTARGRDGQSAQDAGPRPRRRGAVPGAREGSVPLIHFSVAYAFVGDRGAASVDQGREIGATPLYIAQNGHPAPPGPSSYGASRTFPFPAPRHGGALATHRGHHVLALAAVSRRWSLLHHLEPSRPNACTRCYATAPTPTPATRRRATAQRRSARRAPSPPARRRTSSSREAPSRQTHRFYPPARARQAGAPRRAPLARRALQPVRPAAVDASRRT